MFLVRIRGHPCISLIGDLDMNNPLLSGLINCGPGLPNEGNTINSSSMFVQGPGVDVNIPIFLGALKMADRGGQKRNKDCGQAQQQPELE